LPFAAIHVFLGITRIVVIVELDEGKELWPPARTRMDLDLHTGDDNHQTDSAGIDLLVEEVGGNIHILDVAVALESALQVAWISPVANISYQERDSLGVRPGAPAVTAPARRGSPRGGSVAATASPARRRP
jgi:hypothetical protein